MAKSNPAAYEYDFVQTLYYMGIRYKETQRFEKAETADLEALEIRRKLAKIHVAYELDIAHSLHNLGIVYQLTQRPLEAEKAFQESLWISRKLVKLDYARYGEIVVNILRTLGYFYYSTERREDGDSVVIEADSIERGIKKHPGFN